MEFEKVKKIVKESGMFEREYYMNMYDDVLFQDDLTALEHFCKYGIYEDRKPNPDFDPTWYKKHYEDELPSSTNPFLHYILFGRYEDKCKNEDELKNSTMEQK